MGYKADGTLDTHATTWWQIASDENFDTLLVEREEDSVNLTQLDLSALEIELPVGPIWIRCIFKGQSGVFSYWSASTSVEVAVPNPDTLVAQIDPRNFDYNTYSVGRGMTISSDGTKLFIASYDSDAGNKKNVNVFNDIDGVWTQGAKIPLTDESGNELTYAINGMVYADASQTLVTACFRHDYTNVDKVGAVIVSRFINGEWTSDWITPSEIREDLNFGRDIAISDDGTRLAVGADGATNGSGVETGAVFIYELINGEWTESAKLFPSAAVNNWSIGNSVDLTGDGNRLVTSHSSASEIYIFDYVDGNWVELSYLQPSYYMSENRNGRYGIRTRINKEGTVIFAGGVNVYVNDVKLGAVAIFELQDGYG